MADSDYFFMREALFDRWPSRHLVDPVRVPGGYHIRRDWQEKKMPVERANELLDRANMVRPLCEKCPEQDGFDGATLVVCKSAGCRDCQNKVSLALGRCPLGKFDHRPGVISTPVGRYLVHVGFRGYEGFVKPAASALGLSYAFADVRHDLFKTATAIKGASLAVIWNGTQHYSPLVARLCRQRGIPHCFYEWGLLPQDKTFVFDTKGFCGDSMLMGDLSWVDDGDMQKLATTRAELQSRFPLSPIRNRLLIIGQVENDTQILFHTKYKSMTEFVADVEQKYPDAEIVVRPHPKSKAFIKPTRATTVVSKAGEMLDEARKAERIIGLTSTCLYEAGILGVPVECWGEHPLAGGDTEKVLAGILALRSERVGGNLAAKLERFGVLPKQ